MKKLYTLLFIIGSALTFGQTTDLIISEYGEGTTGNSKYIEIYNGVGTDVDLATYKIWTITNGGTWPEATINLTGTLANGSTYVIANNVTDVPGANLYVGSLTFNGDDAIAIAKDIAGTLTLIDAIGTDGGDPGTGWNVAGIANATANNKLTRKPSICSPNADWTVSAGTDATSSEWLVDAYTTGSATNGHANVCSTDPSLVISSPSNGAIFTPATTSIDVNFAVSNFAVATAGAGDGRIAYTVTVNAGAQTSGLKFDTTPLAIPVAPGNNYVVYAELVSDTNIPIIPAVNTTVSFDVAGITSVATLSALRSDVIANGIGKYYELTGEAIITYTRTNRNQKYIQDATAGIIIDDSTTKITSPFSIGDGMTGLKGQTTYFNGLLQLVPLENITASTTGNTVTPQVVTIADVLATPENYESKLLQINGVTFDTTGSTFVLNANVDITAPTAATFRPIFTESSYIGATIPATAADIICYAGKNTTAVPTAPNVYFVSRNSVDLALSSTSFNAIDGLTMYPNPLTGNMLYFTSTANATMAVEIYDLLGKEILKANVVNNAVNVSKLTAGVYVVKVAEEGKTATRKLVIK